MAEPVRQDFRMNSHITNEEGLVLVRGAKERSYAFLLAGSPPGDTGLKIVHPVLQPPQDIVQAGQQSPDLSITGMLKVQRNFGDRDVSGHYWCNNVGRGSFADFEIDANNSSKEVGSAGGSGDVIVVGFRVIHTSLHDPKDHLNNLVLSFEPADGGSNKPVSLPIGTCVDLYLKGRLSAMLTAGGNKRLTFRLAPLLQKS